MYSPQAKVELGSFLGQDELVKCCSDSSDGLARTLYNIIEASAYSGVTGIKITQLPIDDELEKFCLEANLSPEELVFYGGEEYHLIYTINKSNWEKLQQIAEVSGIMIGTIIGEVIDEFEGVVNLTGQRIDNKGYSHFS